MLEGIGFTTSIADQVKLLGQKSVALTDLYWVYGMLDFFNKMKNQDIKPISGVELPYIPYKHLIKLDRKNILSTWNITLLAWSTEWYHNILRIVSESYHEEFVELPLVTNDILSKYHQGIVVLIGWVDSYVYQNLFIAKDETKIVQSIDSLVTIFWSEYVYIDIAAQLFTHYPILQDLHAILLKQAGQYDLPIVTSSWYYYPTQDKKVAYEAALAIKDNTRIYESTSRKIVGEHHILSENEIRNVLANNNYTSEQIDSWIENTVVFAQKTDVTIITGQSLFPAYSPAQTIQDLYIKYQDQLIE